MDFKPTTSIYSHIIISNIINLSLNCGVPFKIRINASKAKREIKKEKSFASTAVRVRNNSVLNDFQIPLPGTLIKSPPTSAAFFSVYNTTKPIIESQVNINQSIGHIFAVYCGHTASCIIRVPVDVTRQQARIDTHLNTFNLLNKLSHMDDIYHRLFRQLSTIVIRELPFCSIKFPLWEFLKVTVESKFHQNGTDMQAYESAICGSIAGGTASAVTMPIDLAYKRITLEKKSQQYKKWQLLLTIRDIAREQGLRGLFAGVRNRVPMISFGGFLFFMTYEQKRRFLFEEEEI